MLATVLKGTSDQRALDLRDFNQSGTSYSCTHMQGITGSTNGTPNANSSRLCTGEPNLVAAPGPLPLLGAAAAFGYSRRIRTRIQNSRQQAPIS